MEPLIITSSPHLQSGQGTNRIMRDVVIALCPALAAGVVLFGWRALLVTAVTVTAAVLSEFIAVKVRKRPASVGDFSAVVTGLLLALCLPAGIPLWMAAFGSVIAIVVVKQMFGGIGQNFVNPALTARIILMISFPGHMSSYPVPVLGMQANDAVTSATPLAALGAEGDGVLPGLADMLLGIHAGSIGETCAVALVAGGLYLMLRRVISPVIPLCSVGTVAVLSLAFGVNPLYQVLGGGLLIGAIFMATDYTTSPLTPWGKVIFAVGCGAITMVIRQFGSLPEGVSFAIVLMNILVPHIEKITRPRPFGEKVQPS